VRRIFLDTMLFIYLFEGKADVTERVTELVATAQQRGDKLYTSYMVAGEVMAGGSREWQPRKYLTLTATLRAMGFTLLPFDAAAVSTFAQLRRAKVKTADAINLACAAAQGVDLFLTGDMGLHKLYVPGIQFIADFKTPIV
jgi:predicted nucleic acid-binding protein